MSKCFAVFIAILFAYKSTALDKGKTEDISGCNETGWNVLPSGLCYNISSNRHSFFQSRLNCQYYESELATIYSTEDWHELFSKIIENNIKSAWIGLTDYGLEGDYKWVSGVKPDTNKFFFAADGSHRSRHDDCVLVQTEYGGRKNSPETSWYPRECHNPAHYICMRGTTAKPLDYLTPMRGRCPHNYFRRGHYCYKIVNPVNPEQRKSWQEASKSCQNDHEESDLLSIEDEESQDYWTAYMDVARWAYWIGLHYKNHESDHSNHYVWNHQQPYNYNNFLNKPLNNTNLCVLLSNAVNTAGKWLELKCDTLLGYVCQSKLIPDKNNLTRESEPLMSSGKCTYWSVEWRGYCYHLRIFPSGDYQSMKSSKSCLIPVGLTPADRALLRILMRQAENVVGVWVGATAKRLSSGNFTIVTDNPDIKSLIDPNLFHFDDKKSNGSPICFKMTLNESEGFVQTDCGSNLLSHCYGYSEQTNYMKKLSESYHCDDKSWSQLNTTCYKYFDNPVLFNIAKKNCLKLAAQVVSPVTHRQEEFLSIISKNNASWISMTINNNKQKITFTWPTQSSAVNVTDFHFNPNALKKMTEEKRCASFNGTTRQLVDQDCVNTRLPYICQKAAISKSACPDGSDFPLGSDCYKIITKKMNWLTAASQCKKWHNEATLASVDTRETNDKILANYRKKVNSGSEFWLGLTDKSTSHFKLWHWADNREPTFTNFRKDFLEDNDGHELCVVMSSKDGRWNDRFCDANKTALCVYHKKPLPYIRYPETPRGEQCPEGFFTYFGDKMCYKVITHETRSWSMANQYCQSLVDKSYNKRATLATIPSESVNYLLYSLLAANLTFDKYWIGYFHKNDLLRSADGSSITYLRSENIRDCGAMKAGYVNGHFGDWTSRDCKQRLPFICQSPFLPRKIVSKHVTNTDLQHVPAGINCPRKWNLYESSLTGKTCYYPLPHPTSYHIGKIACDKHRPRSLPHGIKSTLLAIDSPYELSFLYSMYDNWGLTRDAPLLLGMKPENQNWYWDNGQPVSYTFWTSQPSKTTGCFAYFHKIAERSYYGMKPIPCSTEGNIVCQIRLPKSVHPKLVSFTEKPRECFTNANGTDYMGTISRTVGNQTCVRWDMVKDIRAINQARQAFTSTWNRPLSWASNHCRNPPNMRHHGPFCYVTMGGRHEEARIDLCRVPACKDHHLLNHHGKQINDGSHWVAFLFSSIFILISLACLVGFFIWKRSATANGFIPYFRQGSRLGAASGNGGTSFHNPIYTPANC